MALKLFFGVAPCVGFRIKTKCYLLYYETIVLNSSCATNSCLPIEEYKSKSEPVNSGTMILGQVAQ